MINTFYSSKAEMIEITPPITLQAVTATLMISIPFSPYSKISITATIAFATFFTIFTPFSKSMTDSPPKSTYSVFQMKVNTTISLDNPYIYKTYLIPPFLHLASLKTDQQDNQ